MSCAPSGKCSRSTQPRGCQGFVHYAERLIQQATDERRRPAWIILTLARECANIDLRQWRRPRRFWRSLRQLPPVCFGHSGFRPDIVDDYHPARHYCAFLAVGFFLPAWLAIPFARLWERAEEILLGEYSPRDVALSLLAIQHARVARRAGVSQLPALIRGDLCRTASYGQPVDTLRA